MALKRYWEIPLRKERIKDGLKNGKNERLLKEGKKERLH